ncbi:MAG: extracellular solute-binding protein [Propionibacteriaceae bacterium]|jgi:alpha-glucoside transport system substrate-binding protein|nr:extracellular solute-binding protein [Propionibacteriaceae bacterium]
MAKHYGILGLAGATALALALAGCSTPTTSNTAGTTGAPATTSAPATVTIYGTPTGDEGNQWEASWKSWAAANNITIQYTGDRDFTTNISTKIQGNALPDIAVFPQPGLMQAVIGTGKVQALDATTLAEVTKNFSADWQKYGTANGKQYAVPLDASAKGYIWYSPAAFKTWGVTVPTTWDDLMTLTATIQSKVGGPVWCAGFNSGDATGWPGTDQLAEYVLSASGGDVYDKWVAGDVKFTDQPIADAFTALGKILLDPRYVNAGFGDVASINSTPFGDVANALAGGQCALTNQATFLQASFATAKTAAGTTPKVAQDGDIWAFMMPPVAGKASVVGGGDFAVAFTDSPAVQKVMAYLASGDYANSLITVPGATFITANQGVDVTKQADPLLASAMKTLVDPATAFRFGAGDAMPSVVQQAWWKGTVDWINGTDQTTVLNQIQSAWADV